MTTTTTPKTSMFAAQPIIRAIPAPIVPASEPPAGATLEETYRFYEEQNPLYLAGEVLTQRPQTTERTVYKHLQLLMPLASIAFMFLGACSDSSAPATATVRGTAASAPAFAPVQYFGEEFAAEERAAQLKADAASSPTF